MGWFGSKQSIQQLVQDHYQTLYRFAFRLCGSTQEAEDLTQEAFCQAYRSLAQLREPARAKAWLFTILRNAYLHKVRSSKRMQVLSPEALAEIPDRLPDPLPEIEPAQLQAALAELPEDFRTPLLLFYFEDFSYREIALQLEVPLGTVMSRLARAKAHLRCRLLADRDKSSVRLDKNTSGLRLDDTSGLRLDDTSGLRLDDTSGLRLDDTSGLRLDARHKLVSMESEGA